MTEQKMAVKCYECNRWHATANMTGSSRCPYCSKSISIKDKRTMTKPMIIGKGESKQIADLNIADAMRVREVKEQWKK